MPAKIEPPPWMAAEPARRVTAALTAKGQTVRFVGGCVRDAILGREVRDIDLATPDEPEAVIALLGSSGITAIPTGVKYGTITAIVDQDRFEVTTLRRDAETFGRHARVEFTGDWLADAERRDFTINALYCDPDGTLYDPTGGIEDLVAGRVCFVGDAEARIHEDYLRTLRFFRFLAWYGLTPPEPGPLAMCARLAPKIAVLSGERVAGELLRLLEASRPAPTVALMAQHGILEAIAPQLGDTERLGLLCQIEDEVADQDPLRRLSALIIGKADAASSVSERLSLSQMQKRRLETNVRSCDLVSAGMNEHALRVALYRLDLQAVVDLLLLAFADRDHLERDLQRVQSLVAYAAAWRTPVLPINGDDLQAIGMGEGVALGDALRDLERWWVEQDFAPDRAALLARAWARVSG